MIDELEKVPNCRTYSDPKYFTPELVTLALESVGVTAAMQDTYLGPFSEVNEDVYSTGDWTIAGKVFRAQVRGWHENRMQSIMARVDGHPELAYHASALQPIASVLHNSLKIGPMASSNGSGRQYRIYCQGA